MTLLAALAVISMAASPVVVTGRLTDQPPVVEAPPCSGVAHPARLHRTLIHKAAAHKPAVHASLPYHIVNHRLVKRHPDVGCLVGGAPVTLMSSIPEASLDAGLPALDLPTPDLLAIPPADQPAPLYADDSGGEGDYGYGALPIGGPFFPIGAGPGEVFPGGAGPGEVFPGGAVGIVSATPELSSWFYMIFGTMMIGVMLRRIYQSR